MKKFLLIFLFIFSYYFHLEATPRPLIEIPKDFYLMSIPKAGTHLTNKLLYLLTHREYDYLGAFYMKGLEAYPAFEKQMKLLQSSKIYFCSHPFTGAALVEKFRRRNKDKVMLLQVRDLRDVAVSMVHFVGHDLVKVLGPESTFEERLTFILSSKDYFYSKALDVSIAKAVEWQRFSNVLVCRFEELVGSKGEGDDQIQKKAIIAVAKKLCVPVTDRKIQLIQNELFGNDETNISWTFRKGQIGGWRRCFTPEQMDLFIARWGAHQLALGYSLD